MPAGRPKSDVEVFRFHVWLPAELECEFDHVWREQGFGSRTATIKALIEGFIGGSEQAMRKALLKAKKQAAKKKSKSVENPFA